MADFWEDLLKTGAGIALPGVGGLISDAFTSISGFGGASSGTGGVLNAYDALSKKMPEYTKQSMYNAAGQTGADVERGFKSALDSLQNSAGAVNTASDLNQTADRMLSNVGTQTNIARVQENNANRATRNNVLNMLAQSGSNPAAMVAASGKMGEAQGANALNFLGQAGQMAQGANAAAGNLRAQGQNILDQNLNSRNQIYVDPYKAQVNPIAGGLFGTVGPSAQQDTIIRQPLGGLASMMGDVGASLVKNVQWAKGDQRDDESQDAQSRESRKPRLNPKTGQWE